MDKQQDFLNSMFSYYQRSAEEAEGITGRRPQGENRVVLDK